MQSKAKIVFTDNGIDKAVSGDIISEDEFFIVLNGFNGKTYRIGKRSITCIEEVRE